MSGSMTWLVVRQGLLVCVLAWLSVCARADSGELTQPELPQVSTGLVLQDDGRWLAPEIDAIKKRGVLRVSMMRQDQPPYFYWKDGEVHGLDVDLAATLARHLGVRLQIDRRPTTFNEAVNYLAAGEVDLSISKLSRTIPRTWFIAFSQPYVSLRQALLLDRMAFLKQRKSESVAQTLRSYSGVIGILGSSSYASYVPKNFPKAKLRIFASWTEAVDALKSGKVNAIYRDEYEIRRIIADDPSAALKFQTIILDDLFDRFSVAVNLNAPALLNFVNLVIGERGEPMNVHDLMAAEKSER